MEKSQIAFRVEFIGGHMAKSAKTEAKKVAKKARALCSPSRQKPSGPRQRQLPASY